MGFCGDFPQRAAFCGLRMSWRLPLELLLALLRAAQMDAGFPGENRMSSVSRGRLYIDRDVQRALVLQLVRHWALFVVVLTGILLALDSLSDPQRSIGQHFWSLWQQHSALLVVVGALFPVFLYDSIKLSNRFAGPIMRLRSALREAAAGELSRPIVFRKDDFWQDIAKSYNALLSRLADERQGRAATEVAWNQDEPSESALVGAGDDEAVLSRT